MITLTYFPIPDLHSLSISHVFFFGGGSFEFVFHSQDIGQKFVQLGHLGGNTEVDSPITDLDDKASDNVWVDL